MTAGWLLAESIIGAPAQLGLIPVALHGGKSLISPQDGVVDRFVLSAVCQAIASLVVFTTRFTAIVFLLQGFAPIFLSGMPQPGSWLILVVASLSALVAWGLWKTKRWGLRLAFVFALLQLLGISTPLLSWQFFATASIGFGFTSLDSLWQGDVFGFILDTPLFLFRSYGERLDFAFLGPCPSLPQTFNVNSESFLFVNVVAVALLFFLMGVREEFTRTLPSPG